MKRNKEIKSDPEVRTEVLPCFSNEQEYWDWRDRQEQERKRKIKSRD
jgi:hypothetical protein